MMQVTNALAGIAAKDSPRTARWYSQLLGEPSHLPMPGVFEWKLPRGGVLQVFEDPPRAGYASVTLSVDDLQQTVLDLKELGIEILEQTDSADVSTARVEDPDGNRVVFAQPHSSRVAG